MEDNQHADIDPTWWAPALENAVADYDPVELMSDRLSTLADQDGTEGLRHDVLQALAMATSAMLVPGNWLEPFAPAIEIGNRRSPLPSDLDNAQRALLARAAPLIDRPDLAARIADVAWTYGDRARVDLLDLAVDAYCAAPLDAEVWFGTGKDGWHRAFELLRRRGPAGRERLDRMSQALADRILRGTADDAFLTPDCAALLREHGRPDKDQRAAVAEHLVAVAAACADSRPRLSRHLEREAALWFADDDASLRATERAARTYLAEAAARRAEDPDNGALVEGHFVEKAIAVLTTLPRGYRLASGVEELIDRLRRDLPATRQTALEHMTRVQSEPVDLSEAVSYARQAVAGHTDKFLALAAFTTLTGPMDADRTRNAAEKAVAGGLSHIFGRSTYSGDGRKVAARGGSTRQPDDPAVEGEIVSHVALHAQITAHGMIMPAQELLTIEHRYDRAYLTGLCVESVAVPEGHAGLWGAGLTLGLSGDYGPATAVLAPQLEQTVRTLLKRTGAHTLFVDAQTGVESEKSLNALLDMDEAADVLGAGTIMELRSLLVVQGGPNLRNDTAHGLLDDAAAWGLTSVYLWWFCLRLVLLPVLHARRAAGPAEGAAPDEDAPPATGPSPA